MAVVNIFVPGFHAHRYSGGLLTTFEYANGLVRNGHSVRVIPIEPSPNPQWYKPEFELFSCGLKFSNMLPSLFTGVFKQDKKIIKESIGAFVNLLSRWAPYSYRRARQIEGLRQCAIPSADVSIATSYHTALLVYLYGTGRKFYFCQHYEPYFDIESDFPKLAHIDALSSYYLPDLNLIANSTWLSTMLQKAVGKAAPVCTNAIDHKVFFSDGTPPNYKEKFVVLSYGGRLARWKGFEEAARAVQLARKRIPHLEWRVFGNALLPPDNPIAPYVPLGFITGFQLRRAYSEAHVLLATSWYESFPLFPLEAMACGTAVITTPYGVEDYVEHLNNAFVIPPKDPEAATEALITLYEDIELRSKLANQGLVEARKHTWDRSIWRIKEILRI